MPTLNVGPSSKNKDRGRYIMPSARFFTTEKIGTKRAVTPEGFLVCYDVPLARTGTLLYAEGEIPVDAGPDGIIRVDRTPEEVFNEESMASFNGKVAVIDHPETPGEGNVDVTPENWKEFAVGFVQNPRRGSGIEDDLLIADIVFYEPKAIELINSGKMRQLSCGYDADYQIIGKGRAVQKNIIGNHVALVDDGRCGPFCSIRDSGHNITKGTKKMASTTKSMIKDYLTKAFRARDAKELDDLAEEVGKKVGDEVMTQTPNGSTGEPAKTPEGDEIHFHIHKGESVQSAGAGGSAKKETKEIQGQGATDNGENSAVLKAVTDLSAKIDALVEALTGTISGGSNEYSGLSEPGSETSDDGEEVFHEQPSREIEVGGFKAKAPPGAAGAQNKGSRDMRGRGRDGSTADSKALVEAWQEMMSLAEIISPGIRMPTLDTAARSAVTLDKMCKFRRSVLNNVYGADMELHNVLDNLTDKGYSTTDAMSCEAVSSLFRALAHMRREKNNTTMGRDGDPLKRFASLGQVKSGITEYEGIANLNKLMRARSDEIWGTGNHK